MQSADGQRAFSRSDDGQCKASALMHTGARYERKSLGSVERMKTAPLAVPADAFVRHREG